jgi:predicted RNA-binding protein YlqC (UPF0109 family)
MAEAASASIEDLVRLIVSQLINNLDAMQIKTTTEGNNVRVEVEVASEDAGKVIGRQGRIIKAIRTLARAQAAYLGAGRVEVEILD